MSRGGKKSSTKSSDMNNVFNNYRPPKPNKSKKERQQPQDASSSIGDTPQSQQTQGVNVLTESTQPQVEQQPEIEATTNPESSKDAGPSHTEGGAGQKKKTVIKIRPSCRQVLLPMEDGDQSSDDYFSDEDATPYTHKPRRRRGPFVAREFMIGECAEEDNVREFKYIRQIAIRSYFSELNALRFNDNMMKPGDPSALQLETPPENKTETDEATSSESESEIIQNIKLPAQNLDFLKRRRHGPQHRLATNEESEKLKLQFRDTTQRVEFAYSKPLSREGTIPTASDVSRDSHCKLILLRNRNEAWPVARRTRRCVSAPATSDSYHKNLPHTPRTDRPIDVQVPPSSPNHSHAPRKTNTSEARNIVLNNVPTSSTAATYQTEEVPAFPYGRPKASNKEPFVLPVTTRYIPNKDDYVEFDLYERGTIEDNKYVVDYARWECTWLTDAFILWFKIQQLGEDKGAIDRYLSSNSRIMNAGVESILQNLNNPQYSKRMNPKIKNFAESAKPFVEKEKSYTYLYKIIEFLFTPTFKVMKQAVMDEQVAVRISLPQEYRMMYEISPHDHLRWFRCSFVGIAMAKKLVDKPDTLVAFFPARKFNHMFELNFGDVQKCKFYAKLFHIYFNRVRSKISDGILDQIVEDPVWRELIDYLPPQGDQTSIEYAKEMMRLMTIQNYNTIVDECKLKFRSSSNMRAIADLIIADSQKIGYDITNKFGFFNLMARLCDEMLEDLFPQVIHIFNELQKSSRYLLHVIALSTLVKDWLTFNKLHLYIRQTEDEVERSIIEIGKFWNIYYMPRMLFDRLKDVTDKPKAPDNAPNIEQVVAKSPKKVEKTPAEKANEFIDKMMSEVRTQVASAFTTTVAVQRGLKRRNPFADDVSMDSTVMQGVKRTQHEHWFPNIGVLAHPEAKKILRSPFPVCALFGAHYTIIVPIPSQFYKTSPKDGMPMLDEVGTVIFNDPDLTEFITHPLNNYRPPIVDQLFYAVSDAMGNSIPKFNVASETRFEENVLEFQKNGELTFDEFTRYMRNVLLRHHISCKTEIRNFCHYRMPAHLTGNHLLSSF